MSRAIHQSQHVTRNLNPIRSPSPDIATSNIITPTRKPIILLSSYVNSSNSLNVSLFDDIAQLKRQNRELKNQLANQLNMQNSQSMRVTHGPDQQINRLLSQLRSKQLQIEDLRRKINVSRNTGPINLDQEGITLGMMVKQSKFIAHTRVKIDDQGSTTNNRLPDKHLTSSYHSEFHTPGKHATIPKIQNMSNTMSGSAAKQGQSIPEHIQHTQMDMIISNKNLKIGRLENQLNKVLEQVDRLTRQNHSIKDQNNYLNNKLTHLSNQPLTERLDPIDSSDLLESIRRLQKQNRELKNQLKSNIQALDQQGRQRILKDNQINELRRMIKDLNHKSAYIQNEKNQEIVRLQSQNKLYKQSLESLSRSQSELTSQIERARTSSRTGASQHITTTHNNDSELLKQINQLKADIHRLREEKKQMSITYNNDPQLLREISQLKLDIQQLKNDKVRLTHSVTSYNNDSELQKQVNQLKIQVMRLRAENSLLTKEKVHTQEVLTHSHDKDESRLLTINSELTSQLTQAIEDLRKQKEIIVSLQTEIVSLRNQLDCMNSDLDPLKANAQNFRSECDRLQRIVEQSGKSIAILKGEKEYMMNQAEDYIKMIEELIETLRNKEQQLIHVMETQKSPDIDAYLRDLADLKRELQTLDLQPLQTEIHDKNQRLKTLLQQKLMTSRIIQDIEALRRQNDVLRKKALDAESHFISMKEQNEKLQSLIRAKKHEMISIEGEIVKLKSIIAEYINKEVVYQQGTLTDQTKKEIQLMEEQMNLTQIQQQRSLHYITSLRANFQQVIHKFDSISNKIRDELNRPPENVSTTHTIQRTNAS